MATISVGLQIRKARLEKKVKQGELAARIGVSQAYVNQIENGRRTVSVERIKSIAKALSVPVSTIASPDDLQIIQGKGGFDEHEKKYLLRKEIDAYTHVFEDDPNISRDSEFGELIYNSEFQQWLNFLFVRLFRVEKEKRSSIITCIQDASDNLFKNLNNMTPEEVNVYKDSIRLIYALGADFHELKNKQKYLDFIRWVRSALLSSPSDDIKTNLQAKLSNFLDEEWGGADEEKGDGN